MATIGYYYNHALACSSKEDSIGIDLILLIYWFINFLPLGTRTQLKVLPSAHDVFVLCIRTLQRGGLSSSLSVYNRHWQVTKGDWLPQPGFDLLYKENKELSAMRQHELRTLLRDLPVVAEWQDEGKVLVFRKDLTDLSREDKAEAQSCLRCAAYEWKEGRFEPVDYLNER